MIIPLRVWLIRKIHESIFSKPFERSGGNVEVELDLPNYATKADLIGTTSVDTANLVAKSHLASLKIQADKVDVDKLKNVPVNLSKLSNVVDTDVVKKLCMIN